MAAKGIQFPWRSESGLISTNLDAKRDWGYAKDHVEAMWLMPRQDEPDDYVIATGKTWSVPDFLDRAFRRVGLDWQDYVEFDPHYLRPSEVDLEEHGQSHRIVE